MKVLELFAGSRSIGKAAEELGMQVFSSDIEQFGRIDYICDILDFDYEKVPFVPDVIWASPPCTGFSVAAIGHHWMGGGRSLRAEVRHSEAGHQTCSEDHKDNRALSKAQSESGMAYRESKRSIAKDAIHAGLHEAHGNILPIWG